MTDDATERLAARKYLVTGNSRRTVLYSSAEFSRNARL